MCLDTICTNCNVDVQMYVSNTEIILTVGMSKVRTESRLSKDASLPHSTHYP